MRNEDREPTLLYAHPLPNKPATAHSYLGEDAVKARLRQSPQARANPYINHARVYQEGNQRPRATFFGGPIPASDMPSLADLEGRLLIRQESVMRELREANRSDATFAQIMYQNGDMEEAKKNGWVFKDVGGGNFTFFNKTAPVSTKATMAASDLSDAFSIFQQTVQDLAKADPNKPLLHADEKAADVDTANDYREKSARKGDGADLGPMFAESSRNNGVWMRLPEPESHDLPALFRESAGLSKEVGPRSNVPFLEGEANGTKGRSRLGLDSSAPNHQVKMVLAAHLATGKTREQISKEAGVSLAHVNSWLDRTWPGEEAAEVEIKSPDAQAEDCSEDCDDQSCCESSAEPGFHPDGKLEWHNQGGAVYLTFNGKEKYKGRDLGMVHEDYPPTAKYDGKTEKFTSAKDAYKKVENYWKDQIAKDSAGKKESMANSNQFESLDNPTWEEIDKYGRRLTQSDLLGGATIEYMASNAGYEQLKKDVASFVRSWSDENKKLLLAAYMRYAQGGKIMHDVPKGKGKK